jgi:hypothetical protein
MGTVFSILICLLSHGEIIFPDQDPFRTEKQLAIQEILQVFPKNSSLHTVLQSEKIVLWANDVLMKNPSTEELVNVTEPNFSAVTFNNESFLRTQIETVCQCSLMGKEIGGILVAHPYQAALMYNREGWLSHGAFEDAGQAPPIVIIYHELSHAGDYLKDENYFFDMASMTSKQWKNDAEQSAVVQQNDFVMSVNSKKGTNFVSRLSYGKHQLYRTAGLYSIERLIDTSN